MTTALTPELIATLRSLSPDEKEAAIDILLPDDPAPPPPTDAERAARRELFARRIAEYQRGEVKAYTAEESLARIDALLKEIDPDGC